ncbi:MAG: metallophosphoesterase [Burkholderiaceae bacterium]
MNSKVRRYSQNDKGRDFAVGDIHGCFSKLTTALESIAFSPSVDRLFSVGDLVDRGPESHLVLEWLDKPWFHAICGNHDFMAWRSARNEPYGPVDHLQHGGTWLQELSKSHQQEIGERLAALPLVIEVPSPQGSVGLVHADCPFDNWDHMHDFPLSDADIDYCLWSMDRYQLQSTHPIHNIRAVIHGHMTIPDMKVLGNVYYIDTGGGAQFGHFTLLDLHTLKATKGPGGTFPVLSNRRYR